MQLFNSFVSLTGNLQQVFNTLEAEEKIIDSNFAKNHTLKGNITVKNLTFAYETKPVIKDVSLYVKVGQKLTLCGLANSGKSTLVELIGRLYQFNEGQIFFDEYNINSIKLSSIHKNIGIAQQNTFMLQDSILENIASRFSAVVPMPSRALNQSLACSFSLLAVCSKMAAICS